LRPQLLGQPHALAGELGVELQAVRWFLRLTDLVRFVGGQKIPLRGQRGGQQQTAQHCGSHFLPSISPNSRLSCTVWMLAVALDSISRSAAAISRSKASSFLSSSRMEISAR